MALVGLLIYRETGSLQQQRRARKGYVIFIMFFLVLQSGLRNLAVGSDTLAYYYMFDSVMNTSWENIWNDISLQNGQDFGYTVLCKLFSVFCSSYRVFLIAVALLFFVALGRLMYRYLNSNTEILVSVALYECLYYGFFSITGLRQTVATAILLYALPFVLSDTQPFKNIVKFLSCLFIASTIHKSAFLFAPFCMLPYIRRNRIVFFLSFVLFVPMFSVGNAFAGFLVGTDFEQYAHYMQQSETTGAVFFTWYIVLLSVLVFIKLKSINSYSKYNYVFTSAIAVSLLLSPLLALDPSNQRIVQYYSIFGILVLPQVCRAYSGLTNSKILYYLVFATLVFYMLSRVSPYAFFWQDMQFSDTGMILNDKIIK